MLSDFSDIAFVVMATVISLIVKVKENTVSSNTGYFFYLVLVTIAIGIEIKNSEHLYSSFFVFFFHFFSSIVI